MPRRPKNYSPEQKAAIQKRRKEDQKQEKLRKARKATAIKRKQEFLEEYIALCHKHRCFMDGKLLSITRVLTQKKLKAMLARSFYVNSAYANSWDNEDNEYRW